MDYIQFFSRDFSRERLTAPERLKKTVGYMPGEKSKSEYME